MLDMIIDDIDRLTIQSINAKTDNSKILVPMAMLTIDELKRLLSEEEKRIIDWLFRLKFDLSNYNLPYIGLDEPTKDLIEIKSGADNHNLNNLMPVAISAHVSSPVFDSFNKLNESMSLSIGRTIIIESGYRSPACQALAFFRHLEIFSFDLNQTLRVVALPGYSQHGDIINTAIDVGLEVDVSEQAEECPFQDTFEYGWLANNANRFNFVLPYSENNGYGIIFEPWHWRYLKKKIDDRTDLGVLY